MSSQTASRTVDQFTVNFDPERVTRTIGTFLPHDVIVDPSVQRSRQEREIGKIVGDFNPAALGICTISVRSNGDQILLDGQQRLSAAVAAGYEQPIDAHFYHGLTRAEEAILFRQLNFREKVNQLVLFMVSCVEGDPQAIALRDVLGKFGIALGTSTGEFAAIVAARRIAGLANGIEAFEWAMGIIADAWTRDASRLRYDGRIVEALASIYQRYHNDPDVNLDGDHMRKKLAQVKDLAKGILSTADTIRQYRGGRILVNVIDAIIGVYNRDLKSDARKLPEWARK